MELNHLTLGTKEILRLLISIMKQIWKLKLRLGSVLVQVIYIMAAQHLHKAPDSSLELLLQSLLHLASAKFTSSLHLHSPLSGFCFGKKSNYPKVATCVGM